jgi:hypothetical protein
MDNDIAKNRRNKIYTRAAKRNGEKKKYILRYLKSQPHAAVTGLQSIAAAIRWQI